MRARAFSSTLLTFSWILLTALALSIAAGEAHAKTAVLNPSKDSTLFELCAPPCPADGGGNGAGEYGFFGETFSYGARRAVMAFDVAGGVPAGATITGVTLTLNVSMVRSSTENPTSLHRLTADWDEGASDTGDPGGQGVPPAASGDASWDLRSSPSTAWTTPGGDYAATASATTAVGSTGPHTWGSTPGMVADVQAWLDSPATNFGWIAIGDETLSGEAKRTDTRENDDVGGAVPVLTITYAEDLPVPPWALAVIAGGTLFTSYTFFTSRARSARSRMVRK